MKIGLFGGSFNPVHNAHLRIADEALKTCTLDRVIFIPAADPPHKPVAGDVSFTHRTAMVSIAIADRTEFRMSTVEAERSGKSYSIDTIRAFREQLPGDELYFIVGGDSFLEIGTWFRYAEIFSSSNLIVVERPGQRIANLWDALPDDIKEAFRFDSTTGTLIHASGTETVCVTGPLLEISSTEIRRLSAAGADITRYVSPDVAAYISQQRIYTTCP